MHQSNMVTALVLHLPAGEMPAIFPSIQRTTSFLGKDGEFASQLLAPVETFLRLTALAVAFAAFLASLAAICRADVTHVAVAANFTEPAKEIAARFKEKTGHEAVLIFGASGAFYTQITHGAPFEVFLSADTERPRMAIDNGYRRVGQLVHLCDRQARTVESRRRRDEWRGGP